jgi:3-phenylpropionate/trans-cinnamate dioxygenase ferredoxin subunit
VTALERAAVAKHQVAELTRLDPGSLTRCDLEGTPVCVVRLDSGEVFAIADTCPHEEASLSEGFLEGSAVECPWHSSVFDVRTGELLGPPATEPVQTFQVVIEGDGVWLEATAPRA